MSETQKALLEMQARLTALSEKPADERFQYLVKQGLIDKDGAPAPSARSNRTSAFSSSVARSRKKPA